MKYPEIENFHSIMMYWDGYGKLLRKRDQEEHKDDQKYFKDACWQMIMYARPAIEEAKEYERQYAEARKMNEYQEKTWFPPVDAMPFKKFSAICEKEGDLPQAIWACKQAISLGFKDDGTKGGMEGRLAKLMKKAGY